MYYTYQDNINVIPINLFLNHAMLFFFSLMKFTIQKFSYSNSTNIIFFLIIFYFSFSLRNFYFSEVLLGNVNADIILQESAVTFYFNVFKTKKKEKKLFRRTFLNKFLFVCSRIESMFPESSNRMFSK